MIKHLHALFATLLFTAILAACQQAAEPEPRAVAVEPVAETWNEFVNLYIEEHLEAHPAWAVVQGRHEFDGRLPDWSRAGMRWHATGTRCL